MNGSATGSVPVISLTAPSGSGKGDAIASGAASGLTLSAPSASASGGSSVDVRCSWIEFDTNASTCDVRCSWIEFDTNASTCDVRCSWVQFDTDVQSANAGGAPDYSIKRKRFQVKTRNGIIECATLREVMQILARVKGNRSLPAVELEGVEVEIPKPLIKAPKAEIDAQESIVRDWVAEWLAENERIREQLRILEAIVARDMEEDDLECLLMAA